MSIGFVGSGTDPVPHIALVNRNTLVKLRHTALHSLVEACTVVLKPFERFNTPNRSPAG